MLIPPNVPSIDVDASDGTDLYVAPCIYMLFLFINLFRFLVFTFVWLPRKRRERKENEIWNLRFFFFSVRCFSVAILLLIDCRRNWGKGGEILSELVFWCFCFLKMRSWTDEQWRFSLALSNEKSKIRSFDFSPFPAFSRRLNEVFFFLWFWWRFTVLLILTVLDDGKTKENSYIYVSFLSVCLFWFNFFWWVSPAIQTICAFWSLYYFPWKVISTYSVSCYVISSKIIHLCCLLFKEAIPQDF